MKKRILLFLLLSLAIAGGVYAQNHWVSFELKGPAAGLRYEYVIIPRFTVGAYASYTYITIPIIDLQMNSIEFGATARWYPFGRRFFTELSFGYNLFEYEKRIYLSETGYGSGHDKPLYDDSLGNTFWKEWQNGEGFCIAPGFGWTIDIGKMGGFFLSPGIKYPITIGDRFNVTVAPYLGLGGAF